ncbi:MAG TPA: aminoglycoside phosphotransferase family protein [Chloroflexia bacterium]|nr:aminoglycoside phosphotransferase family protein [Chloroflexia bacterium]
MHEDIYLQPGVPDPRLPDETVLAIARKYIPRAQTVTEVDESGGEARAYVIDNIYVLKVQRPHRLRPRTSLEKEVFFLKELATDQRITVPEVLGYGREEPYIEYILLTRMPGRAFRRLKLEGPARKEVLRALGQTLRLIHSLDQESLMESNHFPGDQTFEEFKFRLKELFADSVALINNQIAEKKLNWFLKTSPSEFAGEALAGLPEEGERVALHSNPGPEHTFIDPSANTFTGLIDFGDAYISHPALDLRRWRHPLDRMALLEGYVSLKPVSESFLKTWRVVMILADLASLASATDPQLKQALEEDLEARMAEK